MMARASRALRVLKNLLLMGGLPCGVGWVVCWVAWVGWVACWVVGGFAGYGCCPVEAAELEQLVDEPHKHGEGHHRDDAVGYDEDHYGVDELFDEVLVVVDEVLDAAYGGVEQVGHLVEEAAVLELVFVAVI